MVALGGVVVDHVEDDLDTGLVQGAHHGLELVDDAVAGPGAVPVVGGQVGDGVVAPVVVQAQLVEAVVVDELVDRHQLDGGDPERCEVVDHGRMGHAGVGAPQLGGHVGVGVAEALDVGLVDHRLVPRGAGMVIVAPVEVGVGHDAPWAWTGPSRCRPGGDRRSCRQPSDVGVDGLAPDRRRRRRLWRRGRGATWPGCSASPARGRRGRAPESRSAARAARLRDSRASSRRRPRGAGSGPRCRRPRTGRPRPPRPGTRRPKSWSPARPRWPRGDTESPGSIRYMRFEAMPPGAVAGRVTALVRQPHQKAAAMIT